jgi:transcriptional regulator with XRE-family HTH domain
MDTVRVGLQIRALRRRRGWTQAKLAARADLSQAAVSRVERGNGRLVTLRTVESLAEALGARASLRLHWHGEDLDRLLDEAHAGLVERVVAFLRERDWDVVTEATFSVYGERGSIDVLAFHPGSGCLLVVEVKSVLPDVQATLGGIDRKARLAPHVARDRGWRVKSVSRLLVVSADRTARRRVARFAATFDLALPLRTMAIRHWVSAPANPIGAVLFLPVSTSTTARHRTRPRGVPARSRTARMSDR